MAKMSRRQLREIILEQMSPDDIARHQMRRDDQGNYNFETNQGVGFLLMSRADAGFEVKGDLRRPDDLRQLANAIEDAEMSAILDSLVLEID